MSLHRMENRTRSTLTSSRGDTGVRGSPMGLPWGVSVAGGNPRWVVGGPPRVRGAEGMAAAAVGEGRV